MILFVLKTSLKKFILVERILGLQIIFYGISNYNVLEEDLLKSCGHLLKEEIGEIGRSILMSWSEKCFETEYFYLKL